MTTMTETVIRPHVVISQADGDGIVGIEIHQDGILAFGEESDSGVALAGEIIPWEKIDHYRKLLKGDENVNDQPE